ncbi:sulfur carrier protein ThiS [Nitratireductor basaltis]|uniref:Sulfur carrier protein ThiS n=1 Tax=Nitratireductor basaltis TaxID=472175 RepID=A0A084UE75_9HYPH|nr:sulfur carrier protein ThiS [Nitratireductor basaltis]KFB11261.1 Sulfur carrier protein ThiS [Nitratireductor basaltis]
MKLIINGCEAQVSATRLDALIRELDHQDQWVATAVNGTMVPRDRRDAHALKEGDRVEILSPMQGG